MQTTNHQFQETEMTGGNQSAKEMTIRELFAAMAMTGYYSNPISNGVITDVAFDAVRAADALIAELNKEQTT